VGKKEFVDTIKQKLGYKVQGRKAIGSNGTYMLKEPHISYNGVFGSENRVLSAKNTYLWGLSPYKVRS